MLVVVTYTRWTAGTPPCHRPLSLLRTGLLVLFYKDNILPFLLKSATVPRAKPLGTEMWMAAIVTNSYVEYLPQK